MRAPARRAAPTLPRCRFYRGTLYRGTAGPSAAVADRDERGCGAARTASFSDRLQGCPLEGCPPAACARTVAHQPAPLPSARTVVPRNDTPTATRRPPPPRCSCRTGTAALREDQCDRRPPAPTRVLMPRDAMPGSAPCLAARCLTSPGPPPHQKRSRQAAQRLTRALPSPSSAASTSPASSAVSPSSGVTSI